MNFTKHDFRPKLNLKLNSGNRDEGKETELRNSGYNLGKTWMMNCLLRMWLKLLSRMVSEFQVSLLENDLRDYLIRNKVIIKILSVLKSTLNVLFKKALCECLFKSVHVRIFKKIQYFKYVFEGIMCNFSVSCPAYCL